jgi:hypothetical protein
LLGTLLLTSSSTLRVHKINNICSKNPQLDQEATKKEIIWTLLHTKEPKEYFCTLYLNTKCNKLYFNKSL